MSKIARMLLVISVCIGLIGPSCNDSSEQNGDIELSSGQLQAVIEEYLKDKPSILGTIVKVDIRGERSYKAASGYTNSTRTTPIEPNTRFIIGSITKMFTAALVHQLIEDGRVQLQSPLISYLSPSWSAILENIEYGSEITVEQALCHRSGIADITESEAFWKAVLFGSTGGWNPIDIIRLVQEKGEPDFKPGQSFEYSNTNYVLLGGLIENVSGKTYSESLRDNILDRAGLDNTFVVEETFGAHNVTITHGYSKIDGRLYDGHEAKVAWTRAAGGIVSTADDLITFYRALSSGHLFADRGTYERMCRLVDHNESYGMGLEVIEDPDIGLHYGHRGSLLQTRALLMHFPEQQITISICHTYEDFSLSGPDLLMKAIVQKMMGYVPTRGSDIEFEGPDILADTTDVIVNEDVPGIGDWDFGLKEEWSLSSLGHHTLARPVDINMGDEGEMYLLDRGSAEILVVDHDGNLLRSFGGHGDGPRLEYALHLYITTDNIHVLDMGRNGDRIKTYDRNGNHLKTSEVETGVSPRAFVGNDLYVAVRSGSDVLNRPESELLELVSLEDEEGFTLAKFDAEDKLILKAILPLGRYILLENDVEIFPRLIVHFGDDALYLGRSDRYLIKKLDLAGRVQMAFSIKGRVRMPLPQGYAEDRASETRVGRGKEMPAEVREEFVTQFPDMHTLYTKITTDEDKLIYVFVPDITAPERQEIDIFSPEGEYLYHAVFELADGLEMSEFVFAGQHLYALVRTEYGERKLAKYRINRPGYSVQ